MMNNDTNQRPESQKSVADVWVNDTYNQLQNLEILERISRLGSNSILEYAEIKLTHPMLPKERTDLRLKNIMFWIHESITFLKKVKNYIAPKKYKEIKKMLDLLKDIKEETLLDISYNQTHSPPKISKYELKEKESNLVIKVLSDIRLMLQDACWGLFRPSIESSKKKTKEAF